MTYLIVILITFLCYQKYRPSLFTFSPTTAKSRKYFCLIVSGILTFLLIVRNDYFGTDTQNYRHMFDMIDVYYEPSLDSIELSSEWGFYTLMYYLNYFGFDFRVLLAISAILYIAGVTLLIYKYSENVIFSYFIFITYNFWVFNTTMRQCFALTFIIAAVFCAIQRKQIPYICFLFAAIMFHATAIVCIPVYFLINTNLNKKNIFILLTTMILVTVFASKIFLMMQEVTGKEYREGATTGYVRMLIMLVLVIIGLLYRSKLSKENEHWIKLLLAALCIQPLVFFNPAFSRINLYFYFFTILLAPNIVHIMKTGKEIIAALYIAYGLYNFTLGSYRAGIRVYPYVYAWENYFEENPNVKISDFDY